MVKLVFASETAKSIILLSTISKGKGGLFSFVPSLNILLSKSEFLIMRRFSVFVLKEASDQYNP